jgi:hypothetical protein
VTAPKNDPEVASAESVAGLAREIEGLRRAVDPLRDVGGRVEDLARLVGQLTDTVNALRSRRGPAPAPSWLLLPTDEAVVGRVLGELCAWLHTIYLRYPDGAVALPECWLWHPDVVEELLWLMHAWCVAYQGSTASVQLAGDWHDRQRPGVARRIRQSVGSCSVERHLTRPEWDQHPTGAAPVPGIDAVAVIARWWAERRDEPAPEPTAHRAPGSASATNGAPHR